MISSKTTVRGTITGDEDLTVEGTVEGQIRLNGDLTIADIAHLNADLEAKRINISGDVKGNIAAPELLELTESATVLGNLQTKRLILAEGARFKGHVEMDFEIEGFEPPPPPAPAAPARRR